MNGGHVAGGGLGAIAGVAIAALGKKIGLDLTTAEAAQLGIATMAVGIAIGHAVGKAWADPGIIPALRRGFFGPKAH